MFKAERKNEKMVENETLLKRNVNQTRKTNISI